MDSWEESKVMCGVPITEWNDQASFREKKLITLGVYDFPM